MTNLPPDYIDEWIQGEDRKLLEIYYTAELSEGGSADEVILRGIKAVLAHPSQMVEVQYQGRLFRMWPGGKVVIGDGMPDPSAKARRADPADSLVHQVAIIIANWASAARPGNDATSTARAAIREVAEWLRENDSECQMGGDAAATADLLDEVLNEEA